MAISFDNALGIHPHSIAVRGKRAEVLASNLANAETPGYKAQDLNFQQALRNATRDSPFNLQRTDNRHFSALASVNGETFFRIPNQPDTGDGNTVDAQIERNAFMQNALEYQAALDFLGSKFKSMTKALKGE